jgi:hypothetical protein
VVTVNVISGGPYTCNPTALLEIHPTIAVNAGLGLARLAGWQGIIDHWCCLDLPEQSADALSLRCEKAATILTSPRSAHLMDMESTEIGASFPWRGSIVEVVDPEGGSLISAVRWAIAHKKPRFMNFTGLDWPPGDRFVQERNTLTKMLKDNKISGRRIMRHTTEVIYNAECP